MAEDTTQELEQVEETNESQSEAEEPNNPDMLTELMEIAKQDTSIEETEPEEEEEVSEEEEQSEEEDSQEEEEQPEVTDSPKEEFVITDDMIKQYPTLKSYRGKGGTDLARAYDNLVREYSRRNQELAELKKKPQQVSKSEEVIDKMPDPLDDPEGWEKWDERRIARLKEELKADLMNEVKTHTTPKPEDVAERNAKFIYAELEKQLPNIPVQSAMEYWINENSEDFFDFEGNLKQGLIVEYIKERPNRMLKEILELNKGRIPKTAPKEVVEAKKKATEQVRKSVRASQKSLPDTSIKKSAPRKDELTSDDKFNMELMDAVMSNNPV